MLAYVILELSERCIRGDDEKLCTSASAIEDKIKI